jgi:hypothetical protein
VRADCPKWDARVRIRTCFARPGGCRERILNGLALGREQYLPGATPPLIYPFERVVKDDLRQQRRAIIAQLAGRTAWRIAIGAAAGLAMAFAAGRLMHSLLYGVTLHSPGVAVATLVTLLVVLALAFVLPAARAASVQTAEAIREE